LVTRTFRGLALGVVALALLLVGGCSDDKSSGGDTSSDDRPTVVVTAQPQDPQSARLVVEQEFGLLVGGDWAGIWDLWTQTAQQQLSKDAYVNLLSTCPDQGKDYEVADVKSVDATTTTVAWKRTSSAGAAQTGSTTVKYQGGNWRIEPDPVLLAAYKQNRCS
jgi:hypothetical protein